MMSVNIIDTDRQFATANNYHAFLTDLTTGQPPRLLGDPAHRVVDHVDDGHDRPEHRPLRRLSGSSTSSTELGMSREFIPTCSIRPPAVRRAPGPG
jgi:hypothetical protein